MHSMPWSAVIKANKRQKDVMMQKQLINQINVFRQDKERGNLC